MHWEALSHSTYNPDLISCDLYLSRLAKKNAKHRFVVDEDGTNWMVEQ